MACSPGIPINMGSPAPDPMNTASYPSSVSRSSMVTDFPDYHVCLNLNAQGHNIFHFFGNHLILGKTELGDTVNQHAAGFVESLKDGHVVTHSGKIAGTGQAGGAGTDHGNLMAVLLRRGGQA